MQLPKASLSTTSLSTYHRPWQPFCKFCSDRLHFQGPIFLISTEHLALFIAFLAEKVCCFNSFNLHFSIKLSPSLDLTKIDMIQLALRGYSKMNPSHNTRLPISLPLLETNHLYF